MATKKVRVNVYLQPELAEQLVQKAKELGMNKSNITSMAVHVGFQAIKMATDPVLKDYFENQMKNDQKTS
jgi:post-segregation antitoxin (ccd killing protein)